MKIGFLGLGVMGAPMAGLLAQTGYELSAYNRHFEKAQSWLEKYVIQNRKHESLKTVICRTVEESVKEADYVFSCVRDDPDAKQIACIAFEHMKKGACYVEHTTTSEKLAIFLAEQAKKKGISYLDAPVSGGQSGAENGTLTIMIGGDEIVYEAIKPILKTYGKHIVRIGDSASGQMAKMVNQICIAGLLQGLAEAVHFAKQSGLDTDAVFSAIKNGAAQSWQMDNRYESMIEGKFDFGFAVSLMRKDLRIVLETARKANISLPVTALIDQFYADLEKMGAEKYDTSSLIKRLER